MTRPSAVSNCSSARVAPAGGAFTSARTTSPDAEIRRACRSPYAPASTATRPPNAVNPASTTIPRAPVMFSAVLQEGRWPPGPAWLCPPVERMTWGVVFTGPERCCRRR